MSKISMDPKYAAYATGPTKFTIEVQGDLILLALGDPKSPELVMNLTQGQAVNIARELLSHAADM